MNPLEILANVGLTLADFNLTSAALSALQRAGSAWTNWTQAQGLAKALGFAPGFAGAIKAFNIGRVLGKQSLWVPSIANVASIPTQMMQVAVRQAASEVDKVRYDVAIEVEFTRGRFGGVQTLYVNVDATGPLSVAEIARRAQAALRGDLIGHSPGLLTDEGPAFDFGPAEIVSVFRYTS